MSVKKMHFILGFFRCGNTLLRSIINQNPNVYLSPLSITPEIFFRLELIKNITVYKEVEDSLSLRNVTEQIFNLYYKHKKQEYIIEQAPWGTDYNYKILIDHGYHDSKFICLIRPLKQIIASWVKLDNPENIEEYVDKLMQERGSIYHPFLSIDNLRKNNIDIKFISYDNLTSRPKETINEIYDYLNIPKFTHSFNGLKQPTNETELKLLGEQVIIRDEVKKIEYDYDQYCPTYLLEKYKNIDIMISEILKNIK